MTLYSEMIAVNTYYAREFAGQDDLNSPPAGMPGERDTCTVV
ncbi:hypothetical protein [Marinobacter sp. ST-43]|nr:hypothetical protein [Marinobacter sp. ST-43]